MQRPIHLHYLQLLGGLKVMLKIGQQLGKINPDEYIINGSLTQKAKRNNPLYSLEQATRL